MNKAKVFLISSIIYCLTFNLTNASSIEFTHYIQPLSKTTKELVSKYINKSPEEIQRKVYLEGPNNASLKIRFSIDERWVDVCFHKLEANTLKQKTPISFKVAVEHEDKTTGFFSHDGQFSVLIMPINFHSNSVNASELAKEIYNELKNHK